MKTVLLIPVGIGIAHTGRLIMIAEELRKNDVRVVFGGGSDAISLIKNRGFELHVLPEFPKSVYDKKIKNNNFAVFTRGIIEKFVKAEVDLYEKVKPNVVVYDARLTVRISSEIAGIKSISIANANFTPYYDFSRVNLSVNTFIYKYFPNIMLELLDKNYGKELVRKVAPKVLQAFLLLEMVKLLPSLIKLGYKIKKDPYQLFAGDLTLLTDIPEYRPVNDLSKNIRMIGPVFWDGGSKLPRWVSEISKKKNIIYVTAGGTGDRRLFIKILKYLSDSECAIVASTGNTLKPEDVKFSHKNLFITDYLPGEFILTKSKLIVFPGGNATCYQALNYGVPQIVTPLHLDQEDNANQLERLGTGKIINPKKGFSKQNLLHAVDEILNNKKYKENSMVIKKILEKYDGPYTAAKTINEFLNP